MIEQQTLFSLAGTPDFDLERTGGMNVAADETFSTATRIQLDDTSWVDHVQGWLTGDGELAEALMEQAAWEQRSRWMYTRMARRPSGQRGPGRHGRLLPEGLPALGTQAQADAARRSPPEP